MAMAHRRVPIWLKLLAATLVPTVLTFAGFGLLSHRAARRELEEELGRRLCAIAEAGGLAVGGEDVGLLQPGDEGSRAYRNVVRKLTELRDATGARRISLLAGDQTSRCDTEPSPIGARYFALDGDRAEIAAALAGRPTASVLFDGHDGAVYKRGFARVPGDGAPTVVAVEGSAALYEQLAGFRRTLLGVGAAGILIVASLSLGVARFITRPVRRLEAAARAIGEGDLEAKVAVASSDEIGFLARTLDGMREQLRARDQRLQMMLAGIAHEVRNPLGGMELFAGLLREELAGDPEKLAHVAKIERELGHLKGVVSDFLDYARRPRPELHRLDAAQLVSEVGEVLAADAERAGVSLTVNPGPAATVSGDPGQLKRALLNLGRNALQASQRGGRVSLGCRRDHSRVHLSVEDSGCGIVAEKLREIFAPFFTTREQGTGLGLAFVAEIAKDHGGAVHVESKPGQGSRFTLDLPEQPEEA